MPEGDTIARIAARLAPVLEGETLTRFEAPRHSGVAPEPGEVIESVRAHGKYLNVTFSGGLSVQSHLRMSGSWHLYRSEETWQRPEHQARVIIGVEGYDAVCFLAPTVRIFATNSVDPLRHLGPDLCLPDVDIDTVVARAIGLVDGAADIATLVLDQRVAAGIGNVFKSEALFACGIDPRRSAVAVSASELHALFATAHRQLRSNLGPGPRTTVPQGLAVYGRAGAPCWTCGDTVRSVRTGEPARVTYWCPTCQPA